MNTASQEQACYRRTEELGGLELLDASYHRQNFSRHTHEGYTLGVIETGAQRFFRTGANHVAPRHSIILVNADEVHNGQSATPDGWSYRACYPTPNQFAALARQSGLAGAPYFPAAVVADAELALRLRQLFDLLAGPHSRLQAECLLYPLLLDLMCRHGRRPGAPAELGPAWARLARVKALLDEAPQADLSLDQLADLAAMSPYHLLRQFARRYGLPPHAYQIQARLRLSRDLLRQGVPLIDVAPACGFHDQSHLHRHFKRAMGLTPGQFAAAVQGKKIQVSGAQAR